MTTVHCDDCGHTGDECGSTTESYCGSCGATVPYPKEDRCQECGDTNCMLIACAECGGQYWDDDDGEETPNVASRGRPGGTHLDKPAQRAPPGLSAPTAG